MRRSLVVLALLSVVLLVSPAHAQCGVERWSVKTGTDPNAPSVNLGTYTSSTIYNMLQSAHPATLPANSRIAPRELTQYRLSGTLTKYKRETDSDYHLVIKDSAGRTMIIEIPSINCVGAGSPFTSGIRNARAEFDAKLTATSSFKTVTAPVTIRGVGFWDFLHGQTGVAPNGIEIHPVLDIQFTGAITASEPGIVALEAHPPVQLPADMVEDNDGGRARVYRGGEPLGDVLYHGGGVITRPRLRIVFAGDEWDNATRLKAIRAAHDLSSDLRFQELERYGVIPAAMTVDSSLSADLRGPRHDAVAGAMDDLPADATDLDVQRLLADAVAAGRIQHLDEDEITIVLVHPEAQLAVGMTRDWSSYHSLFHPTELGMPYVVVRAGPNLRESLAASVLRSIIDPKGDGWY